MAAGWSLKPPRQRGLTGEDAICRVANMAAAGPEILKKSDGKTVRC
jgi:hypothetical protein